VSDTGNNIADIIVGLLFITSATQADDDTTGSETDTNLELTGPYVGLRAAW